MKKLIFTGITLMYLVMGNGLAFLDKAVDKHIREATAEQSAIESMLNYTPVVNSIGYGLGHELFYGDNLENTLNQLRLSVE